MHQTTFTVIDNHHKARLTLYSATLHEHYTQRMPITRKSARKTVQLQYFCLRHLNRHNALQY